MVVQESNEKSVGFRLEEWSSQIGWFDRELTQGEGLTPRTPLSLRI